MSDNVNRLNQALERAINTSQDGATDEERVRLMKIAFREVIKEWLDDKAGEFGRWSLKWIISALGAAIAYFVLTHSGWVRQ